jgi:integrase
MIYKRNGRWSVRIDLDRDASGKRIRRAIGVYNSKKEAESAERAALKAREDGLDFNAAKSTIREVCDRFVDRCRAKGLAPSTLVRYKELFRDLDAIANVKLGDLNRAHVAGVYAAAAKRGLAPKTLRGVHTALHAAVAWAAPESAALRALTVAARDLPGIPKNLARALTEDEVRRLFAAAVGTPWESFVVLSLCTGARRSELAALRWQNIDFTRQTVRISNSLTVGEDGNLYDRPTKTSVERVVPLNGMAVEALRAHRARQNEERLRTGPAYQNDDRVFTDAFGQPWNPRSISNGFRRTAQAAKVTARLHDLRHSCATWLLQGGTDVRTVAAVLGHSNAVTTLTTYAHVMPGAQAQAVERITDRLRVVASEK